MKIHEKHLHIVDALNVGEVSEQIIMASAAGWYVGTVQVLEMPSICSGGILVPFSRDTDYMSEKEAEDCWEYNPESD